MNEEITIKDIIKAIDEMFDEEKLQENETFWRGYNYGITRVQQYIVKLNQELQRKDNIIDEFKKWLEEQLLMEIPMYGWTYKSMLNKINELEGDNKCKN